MNNSHMIESKQIKYKKGYKYQLCEESYFITNCYPKKDMTTQFLILTTNGELTIKKGYAWDGPSGISIDTKDFMRGSLVHDALYQLMRMGLMNDVTKQNADKKLQQVCINDGMWGVRAWYVYEAVAMFGEKSTLPRNKKEILIAP